MCSVSNDREEYHVALENQPNFRKEFKYVQDSDFIKRFLNVSLGYIVEFDINKVSEG